MSETPRRPGRPRVEEPGVRLSTYIRNADYDKICRLALKHDRSVGAIVRDRLVKRLREAEDTRKEVVRLSLLRQR